MADVKISELTDGTAVVTGDLVEIERPGSPNVSRRVPLGTAAGADEGNFAAASHGHTLSDISDAGNSAGLDVGTTAGTVAAGDDSRITGALQPADIGSTVQGYDADTAKLDVEDQTLTGGARVTSKSLGTITTGTVTPDPGDRPQQHYINGGAHTLAPGSNAGSYLLDITNNSSAGAITTSGWTLVDGDSFTTTDGDKFRCHCSIGEAGSLLSVKAMQ